MRAGKTDKAREALETLIANEPNAVQGHLMLGRLEEKGNPEKAAACYEKALAIAGKYGKEPLKEWEKEMFRIDSKEIARRLDSLKRGVVPEDVKIK